MTKTVKVFLALLICFASCDQKKTDSTPGLRHRLSNLIVQADREDLSPQKKLQFALAADSIATGINDRKSQIACARIIGSIHVDLGNLSLAKTYFQRTFELATALNNPKDAGDALNNLGIIYFNQSEYDSAIKYYTLSNEIATKLHDQVSFAQGLTNIGMVYKNQGNFQKAFQIGVEAARIFDSCNAQSDLAYTYTTLGNILKELGRYDDDVDYQQKALKIFEGKRDSIGIGVVSNNIANAYLLKKNYQRALTNYLNALDIKGKFGQQRTTGNILDNIGQVYFEIHDYSKAEDYYKKALKLKAEGGDKNGVLETSNRLSKLLIKTNDLENAKSIALQTQNMLPKEGFLMQRLDNALVFAELYEKEHKFDLSSIYASESLLLKDSLLEMSAGIAKVQLAYATAQKDKELLLKTQLQKIQSLEIRNQRNFIMTLIIVLLSLILMIFFLFKAYMKIREANNKIEILMNELNHRVKNNLQLVSDMMNLQMKRTRDMRLVPLLQANINRVESMNIIHTLLYQRGFNGNIAMKGFLNTLISNIVIQNPFRIHELSLKLEDKTLDISRAIPVGLIINELITNCFKYFKCVNKKLNLEIIFIEENGSYTIEISDNGGHWNIKEAKNRQNGLGLLLVESLAKQLNGSWNHFSNDNGSIHIINFKC